MRSESITPEIRELVAALPVEAEDRSRSAQQALQDLIGDLAHKPVPVGRLARAWVLGSMKAKIAVAYLAYWLRSSYASASEQERMLNETHLKAAIKLLGGMSYLRGAIMKVGQCLAQYPSMIPREFVETLSTLNFEAPPMHFALLREQVRNELGKDPEDIFAEFDTTAFAAASLGQVHRARLPSGERVAVKIQYPNIARTIQADMSNMMALLAPMRLSGDWDNIRKQCDDIRLVLQRETDYVQEADFTRRARAVFTSEDRIVVPRIYEEYSTQRVLTMEYIGGVHLEEYLTTQPTQEERDRFGELLMRASFRIAHAAKIWYSDSSPGNYLFMKDGRLGLIDFGCCREFSEQEWDYYKLMERSYREGGEALRRALLVSVDLEPHQQLDPQYVDFLVDLADWYNGYLVHEGKFDFGNEEFIRRGMDLMAEIARKRYFRSLPVNTWIGRHLVGLRMIAHRLRARIDMKIICEEESQGIFY